MDSEACQRAQEVRKRASRDMTLTQVTDGVMSRSITMQPGYDHRSFGCDHGQHGMTVRFLMQGPLGAVQFVFYLLDMVPGNFEFGNSKPNGVRSIMSVDLGYHSPVPIYENQRQMDCDFILGGRCYYDGSGLDAGPVLEAFAEHGPHAVWAELARMYQGVFVDQEGAGFGQLLQEFQQLIEGGDDGDDADGDPE